MNYLESKKAQVCETVASKSSKLSPPIFISTRQAFARFSKQEIVKRAKFQALPAVTIADFIYFLLFCTIWELLNNFKKLLD
jgi:hypothetical protein